MFLELFHRNRDQNLGHFQAFNVKIEGLSIFELYIFLEMGVITRKKAKNMQNSIYDRALFMDSHLPDAVFFDEAL